MVLFLSNHNQATTHGEKWKLLYVSQSVCLGVKQPCGTCNLILLPVGIVWSYFTTDGWSVSQSVCLGAEHPRGTRDQILLPVGIVRSYFTVSQYVLVSSTLVGLATRYHFLWECWLYNIAIKAPDTKLRRKYAVKIVLKHAQSTSIIQMEVIIYPTKQHGLSKNIPSTIF
jgi:hypothetical protein